MRATLLHPRYDGVRHITHIDVCKNSYAHTRCWEIAFLRTERGNLKVTDIADSKTEFQCEICMKVYPPEVET